MLVNKKFFKPLLLSVLTSAILFTSQEAKSFAGFGDINIDGQMNMMNNITGMLDMGTGQLGQLNQIKSLLGNQLSQLNVITKTATKQESLNTLASFKANFLAQAIPDTQSCSILGTTGGGMQSINNIQNEQIGKRLNEKMTKQDKTGELNTVIQQRIEKIQRLACSEEDAKNGVLGCSTPGKFAGKKNSSMLLKGNVVDKDNNSKSKDYIVNYTIEDDGQKELALNYVDQMIGNKPVIDKNRNVNQTTYGAEYSDRVNTYLSRQNIASNLITENVVEKFSDNESNAKYDGKFGEIWKNVGDKDYQQMYGQNAKKPANPSSSEIMRFLINKNFMDSVMKGNSLGGEGKASEAEYRAMVLKLMFDNLEAQKNTQMILSAILSHLQDPVTYKDLTEMRERTISGSGNIIR